LLVALIERAAVRFADPLLGDVAPFALLLVALWIRPWGLFGRQELVERV
jgi:branched-subunit amino acid ABC-type transport system permease component